MMPVFADYMHNLGFLSDSDRNSLKTKITFLVETKVPKEQVMKAMVSGSALDLIFTGLVLRYFASTAFII